MDYAALEQICSEKGTTPTAVALKLGLSRGNVSKNEKECLSKFRRLSDTDQGKILERMEVLLEKN